LFALIFDRLVYFFFTFLFNLFVYTDHHLHSINSFDNYIGFNHAITNFYSLIFSLLLDYCIRPPTIISSFCCNIFNVFIHSHQYPLTYSRHLFSYFSRNSWPGTSISLLFVTYIFPPFCSLSSDSLVFPVHSFIVFQLHPLNSSITYISLRCHHSVLTLAQISFTINFTFLHQIIQLPDHFLHHQLHFFYTKLSNYQTIYLTFKFQPILTVLSIYAKRSI
jgi:hypothetical protein